MVHNIVEQIGFSARYQTVDLIFFDVIVVLSVHYGSQMHDTNKNIFVDATCINYVYYPIRVEFSQLSHALGQRTY